jgi:hypothetical protein
MTAPDPKFDPADRELARQALMAEQEFAWSLIKTYREFQMQAVGIAIALYAAVLGLVGASIDSEKLIAVASYATALLPYPTSILVLAFAVMEVRIRRASRHSVRTIAPKLESLRTSEGAPLLLEWERDPSRHLSRFERSIANSAVFVVAMALPAVGGVGWHLFARRIPISTWHPVVGGIGAFLLIVAALIAAFLSIGHESRTAK